MTSKTAEDVHLAGIQKVLMDSKLECSRTVDDSIESSITAKTMEEEDHEATVHTEEPIDLQVEEYPVVEEEKPEESPDIFPTPSLRRLLPDKVRSIEAENRIHVLPEIFRTDIDPMQIPKISTTMASKYIDILAEMTGCKMYKSSLAEFWFLDTLANLLRRAQTADLSKQTQAVLIHWFCEWMKEMQHFDAADRPRMIRRFQDNMLAAARFVGDKSYIPTPEEIGVFYKAPDPPSGKASPPVVGPSSSDKVPRAVSEKVVGQVSVKSATPFSAKSSGPEKTAGPLNEKDMVVFDKIGFECSLLDLAHIIHYIFDLFSTDYQYNLVRSVFTFSPDYIRIDAPYQMQNPKRIYAPLKVKKEKTSVKKEKPPKGKKSRDIMTEEYLALQELIHKEQIETEKRDERYREQWNLRSHILPLNMAATEELFDLYWPPPPPPEPEPESQADSKKKAKGEARRAQKQ